MSFLVRNNRLPTQARDMHEESSDNTVFLSLRRGVQGGGQLRRLLAVFAYNDGTVEWMTIFNSFQPLFDSERRTPTRRSYLA